MALERVGWRDRGVVELLYLCLWWRPSSEEGEPGR